MPMPDQPGEVAKDNSMVVKFIFNFSFIFRYMPRCIVPPTLIVSGDVGLVGHRLAVIAAPPVVENVLEGMVLWSPYMVQGNVIVNIVAEDLVGHCLASGIAAGSLKAETLGGISVRNLICNEIQDKKSIITLIKVGFASLILFLAKNKMSFIYQKLRDRERTYIKEKVKSRDKYTYAEIPYDPGEKTDCDYMV